MAGEAMKLRILIACLLWGSLAASQTAPGITPPIKVPHTVYEQDCPKGKKAITLYDPDDNKNEFIGGQFYPQYAACIDPSLLEAIKKGQVR